MSSIRFAYRARGIFTTTTALIAAALLLPAASGAQARAADRSERAVAGMPTLARGAGYADPAGSPQVRRLQRWLRRQDTRPGPIDGLFGPRTEAAVLRFQRGHGLRPDGIAGPITVRHLRPRTSARLHPRRPVGTAPRRSPSTRVIPAERPRSRPVGGAQAPASRTGSDGVPLALIVALALSLAALALLYRVLVARRKRARRAGAGAGDAPGVGAGADEGTVPAALGDRPLEADGPLSPAPLEVAAAATNEQPSSAAEELGAVATNGQSSTVPVEVPALATNGQSSPTRVEVPALATNGQPSSGPVEVAVVTNGQSPPAALEVAALATNGQPSPVPVEVAALGTDGPPEHVPAHDADCTDGAPPIPVNGHVAPGTAAASEAGAGDPGAEDPPPAPVGEPSQPPHERTTVLVIDARVSEALNELYSGAEAADVPHDGATPPPRHGSPSGLRTSGRTTKRRVRRHARHD